MAVPQSSLHQRIGLLLLLGLVFSTSLATAQESGGASDGDGSSTPDPPPHYEKVVQASPTPSPLPTQRPSLLTHNQAHAAMAASAWGFFFPLGSILLRLSCFRPIPHVIRIHYTLQIVGLLLFSTAFGLGVWMAHTTSQFNNAHPIIGIIILGLVLPIQPVLGTLHHLMFKQKAAQGHSMPNLWWGRTHIWLGRAVITLGMINGGLGLQLSGNASRGEIIAYGIIVGVIWITWISLVVGAAGKMLAHKKEGSNWMAKEDLPAEKSINGNGNGNRNGVIGEHMRESEETAVA